MRSDAAVSRSAVITLALLVALVAIGSVARPAAGDPGDPEGATATLRQQLDAASKGYLDASAKLEASKTRQQQLTAELTSAEGQVAAQTAMVAAIAAAAYKSAGLVQVVGVFDGGSPATFLDRVTLLNAVAAREDAQVHRLWDTREQVNAAKAAIDTEVKQQQDQLKVMAQRKQQAESALRAAGGGQTTGGFVGARSAQAIPAPRNPNGTWPAEACSVYEPTTGGCVTPRMQHAMIQAKAAGFTRYVSCYRAGGGGEHPLGRACDFAAAVGGFGGAATGGDRTYGNNLAVYFVNNASRLGVLYVIWYRQIWLPGSGWRGYSGYGSPAAEHTNHVHLSVY